MADKKTVAMSPVPKSKEVEIVSDYQIELHFNAKAELYNVNSTKPLSLEMINNHVAIALLYLAQEIERGSHK